MEEFQLSESDEDSDQSFDIYGADPVFESKEKLDEFMASCNLEKSKGLDENVAGDDFLVDAQNKIEKNCTCNKCEDIWSDLFPHICCQQIKPG